MPLRLNTLFAQEGIAPSDVRLLRHKDNRSAKGRSPFELWRDNRPAFEFYQSGQSPSNKTKLKAPFWAAFVVDTAGATLLAGVYACRYLGVNEETRSWPHNEGFDAPGTADVYELNLDSRFADLSGRLIIEWGDGKISWIQRADNQNKTVLEIRTDFREPNFPGYAHFVENLSSMERLPVTWTAALRASRGVYLLTCPATKEQYIGSATGNDGFLGRWLEYVRNGHGGNIELKRRNPSDYQVSILEVARSTDTTDRILELETLWKQKLQSREMGLNRN